MKISEQRVEYLDHMGSDLSVVNAARVSFAKESKLEVKPEFREYGFFHELADSCFQLSEKDQKLINYLAKHNHWSPFAHTSLSFRIKAPIFVARQMVKHQVGLVWNEVSRRYVDDEPEFYFPKEWRGRPVNAKQGSSGVVESDTYITQGVMDTMEQSLADYLGMIDLGVAPEQARMVLPQNTMTEWIWTGSLMAFARVCKLRLDPHAQQESREIAIYLDGYCKNLFPVSWNALFHET